MRDCAPTRQPGAFRLVFLVMVPLLLMQVTALAQGAPPQPSPDDPYGQPAGQPGAPAGPGAGAEPGAGAGLGATPQGAVAQASQPPAQLGALTGQELRRQGDINEAASGLINAMLGDDGPAPEIERVLVLEDSERRLVLRVTTKDAAHASIYGRVRDHQAQFQQQVAGFRYQVPPDTNDVDLTFALSENVPPGTSFDSASLVLYLVRPGGSFARPDRVRTYLLPKRWESTIRADNVLVSIPFVPVGEVAQGATPTAHPYAPQVLSKLRMPTYTTGYTTRGDDDALGAPEEAEVLWLGDEPPKQVSTRGGANVFHAQLAKPMIHKMSIAQNALKASVVLPAITNARIYSLSSKITDRRGKGPDLKKQVDLLNQVHIDESVQLELGDVTTIHRVVFEDQNANARLYYYAPRGYQLDWNAQDGHQMRMIYQAAEAEGQAGGVVMSAVLRTGVDNRDVELMRKLLRARLNDNRMELLPLPPAGPPSVSLGGELTTLYDIPADRITIQAGSESNDAVQIAWVTDTLTKENIQVALLEDQGLAGSVTYAVEGGGGAGPGGIGAKLRIALADPGTFGRIGWVRGQDWRNLTPYPVRMRYMHALMIRNGRPVVYSWSLGDAVVPPLATARYDDRLVGSWVDSGAVRTWIEYAVDGGCPACDEQVIAGITGGVSGVSASQLTFKTISPLDDTGAVELTVLVRTRYLHPTDREMAAMPEFALDQDRQEFRAPAPVYLAGRQPGEDRPGDPLFEYQLAVTMADGQVHRASTWIPSNHLRVVIGSHQVRQALGYVPGETPGPSL